MCCALQALRAVGDAAAPAGCHRLRPPTSSFTSAAVLFSPAAIESFSKLADSIFFRTAPRPPSAADSVSIGPAAARSAGGSGGAGNSSAAAAGGDEPATQLYVNQLVSASLRWREQRVVVHQEAGASLLLLLGCCCWPARLQLHSRLAGMRSSSLPLTASPPACPVSLLVPSSSTDLYHHEGAAVARLALDIYPPAAAAAAAGEGDSGPWGATWARSSGDADEAGSGRGGVEGETRRFVLNWRIPGWATAAALR